MMNRLELKQVVKQYADKTAVNGVTLNVKEGEIYGLLGANGAGKTTTMRMVLGLIHPDGGISCTTASLTTQSCSRLWVIFRKSADCTRR